MRNGVLTCIFVLVCIVSVDAQKARIISEKANLRGTPTAKGKIVTKLERNANLDVYKINGVWYLVQSKNYVGWVHGNTIKLNAGISQSSIMNTPVKKRTKKRTRRKNSSSRVYIRGSRGGCYYINSRGNKSYVSRSLCK